jgi:hypothetical protein
MTLQKKKIIQLHENDNVAVVVDKLQPGDIVQINNETFVISISLDIGHKLAVKKIKKQEDIVKYGVVIGKASEDIEAGMHVHTHNVKSNYTPTYTLN